MNLFTIITTILGLLLTFLSLLTTLKGNSAPPQNTSPDNHSYVPEYKIQSRNQKTLEKWLSFGIFAAIASIFLFTIIYNRNIIPSTGTSNLLFINYLNNALYLGVGYTTKITLFSIPILSIGIVIKNIKNPSSQFRIFNIITYLFLTDISIWLIFLVFRLDYLSFIPTNSSLDNNISNNIFFNLLYILVSIISLLQLGSIYWLIQSSANELIFARQYSNILEHNAKYLCSRIMFILFFAFLIWYWTCIWQ